MSIIGRLVRCMRIVRDCRGVAIIEFALALPLFLGFMLGAIECGNYVLANVKTQRMAAMAADLVAQSGVGAMGVTEAQIYDLFAAMDVSAQPYDIRKNGRVVITAVQGVRATTNSPVVNTIVWQRFDGGYTTAAPVLGCWTAGSPVTLPRGRALMEGEILFHVQVSLNYQAIIGNSALNMMSVPTSFTRTAMFRPRSASYTMPKASPPLVAKTNCTSPNGL